MSRIPDDLAIRYGAILDEYEGALKTLNSSKSSTLEDLRADLRKLGMVGAEISAEIAMLKGAVKLSRMTETERQKSDEKDDGVADYVNILALARARAHVRGDEHDAETGEVIEPDAAMRPQTAGSETAVANSTPGSGAGTVDAGEANWPTEMTTASPANEPAALSHASLGAAEAGDGDSAPSLAAIPVADRSQPNPICRDPGDCGVYASWAMPCQVCKAAAAHRSAA